MTNFEARIDKISKNMRANNLDCSSNSTCSPELNLLSFDILVKSSGVFLQRKQRPTIKRIHWNFCCQTDILIDIFNNYLRRHRQVNCTWLYQNVFITWFLKVHLTSIFIWISNHMSFLRCLIQYQSVCLSVYMHVSVFIFII